MPYNNNYSSPDILLQLDQCAEDFNFPVLDNGYIYPVDSRLTAYRDDQRWIIVIEIVGHAYRSGGHDGIENCHYIYGNCLHFPPGMNNDHFLLVTANSEEGDTFMRGVVWTLNPQVHSMMIREKKVPVLHDPAFYAARGITLGSDAHICLHEYMRAIAPDYRDAFFAADDEIRTIIPMDIPQVLRLNEWYHPDLSDGALPGNNETFQMIAKVLETGDPSHYQPTSAPNTHWKHWPVGGTL